MSIPQVWLVVNRRSWPVRFELCVGGATRAISFDEAACFGGSSAWLANRWVGTAALGALRERADTGDQQAADELRKIDDVAATLASSVSDLNVIARTLVQRHRERTNGRSDDG